jgi:adenylate kinase family enzyme
VKNKRILILFYSLQTYDYVHISVGDLLRDEAAKSNSNLGKEINDNIKNGSLISTEIICKLLENVCLYIH